MVCVRGGGLGIGGGGGETYVGRFDVAGVWKGGSEEKELE